MIQWVHPEIGHIYTFTKLTNKIEGKTRKVFKLLQIIEGLRGDLQIDQSDVRIPAHRTIGYPDGGRGYNNHFNGYNRMCNCHSRVRGKRRKQWTYKRSIQPK